MIFFWIVVIGGLIAHIVWAWVSQNPGVGELAGGYLALVSATWAIYLRFLERRLANLQMDAPYLALLKTAAQRSQALRGSEALLERKFFNVALVAVLGAALQAYGPPLIDTLFIRHPPAKQASPPTADHAQPPRSR